jgi:hypothetical protein
VARYLLLDRSPRLGDDVRHRQPEVALGPTRQVPRKPTRAALRQRRQDDLVDRLAAQDLPDRGNGVRLTHLAVDLGAQSAQPEQLLMEPLPRGRPAQLLRRGLGPPFGRIRYPRCGSSWSSGVAGTSTWKWQGPAPCAREAAPEAGHHQGSDWPPRGTDARSSPPAAAVSRSIDPRIRTWNVPPDQLGRYKAAGARRGELLAAPVLDGLGQHPGHGGACLWNRAKAPSRSWRKSHGLSASRTGMRSNTAVPPREPQPKEGAHWHRRCSAGRPHPAAGVQPQTSSLSGCVQANQGLKISDQRLRWSGPVQWAWEELNLRLHPDRKRPAWVGRWQPAWVEMDVRRVWGPASVRQPGSG